MAKRALMTIPIFLVLAILSVLCGVDKIFADTFWDELRAVKQDTERQWGFYADLGAFYSDNVAYASPDKSSEEVFTPLRYIDSGAFNYQLEMGVNYKYPAQIKVYQISLDYTYFYNANEDKELNEGTNATSYDLMVHIPTAKLILKYDPLTFQLPYTMNYLYIGGRDTLNRQRVTPKLTYGDIYSKATSVIYRFTQDNYLDEDIPDGYNSTWSRDSIAHAVGIEQQLLIPWDLGRFSLGYMFEGENADGNDYDNLSHIIQGKLFFTNLPYGARLDFRARVEFSYYTSEHSTALTKREDTYQVYYARLSREIVPGIELALKYLRTYNSSNIEEFDFINNSLGVTIKAGFF